MSVDRRHQRKRPYIKFSFIYQQGIFDVLLYDIGSIFGKVWTNFSLYFVQVFEYLDSSSTIRVFSWLDNPYVISTFFGKILKGEMFYTILNVEGQWYAVKHICTKSSTILLHISKKRFFVCNDIVVFQFTIDTYIQGINAPFTKCFVLLIIAYHDKTLFFKFLS